MEINIYSNKIKELLKDSNIELLSLTEEDNKFTLEILFNENIVKLTTDFKIFCFTELKNINVTFLNSKLTHFLKDSLSGNTKTIFIATIKDHGSDNYQQNAFFLILL